MDPASTPRELSGRTLSHFLVGEPLDAGGMGVVYKAVDVRLQRTVALKVLPPDETGDPARRARRVHEARAASILNHPNSGTVYEVDCVEGIDFIVMEHVAGRSLDAIIGQEGLPAGQAVDYAVQVLQALAAAHACGIIHRDLKPRNIMVGGAGLVKVLDFGLAKRIGARSGGHQAATESLGPQTSAGTVLGTVAYMSPEQAQAGALDARSDLFSFGVVLHEMLTGKPPFTRPSMAETLSAILRDAPPPLRALRPDLPAELERIVDRLLAKDPARRYPDASAVLADLRVLASPATASLAPPPAAGAPSRRAAGWVAVGAAAALLAAAAAWRWSTHRAASAPLQFRLVSTFAGSHHAPSFSPDGRMFAFVESSGGASQIWVKPLGEGEPVQITSGDVPATRPRWSPRGDQILFERSGQGIWSVPPLGGPARRVLDQGRCAAFFPNGERIVYDRGLELWTARGDGSEAAAVPGVPPNFFAHYVQRCGAVSPDGRWIAYFQAARGPNGDFWVVPATGGTPRRLTHDDLEGGGVAWMPDGRHLVISSSRGGARTLWRIPVDGGEPDPVTTGAGEDVEPEVSADGAHLIYGTSRNASALIVLDPATAASRTVLERRVPITGPAFSPDGARLAFFMSTAEAEQLFTVNADGTDLRQVTRGERQGNIMPQWTPDGAELVFYQELGSPSLRRVPAAGGPSTALMDGWRWDTQQSARLDPAGRRLAYDLLENGTLAATVVRDLATGHEARLPRVIWSPRWSPDGLLLVGHDAEAREILLCESAGGSCQAVGEGWRPHWSGDGSRLFFARAPAAAAATADPLTRSLELWVMARDGSGARRVTTLVSEHVLATPFDVSARDEIAWVQYRPGRRELWMATLAR
jgi:Tol biopolymer transport system component